VVWRQTGVRFRNSVSSIFIPMPIFIIQTSSHSKWKDKWPMFLSQTKFISQPKLLWSFIFKTLKSKKNNSVYFLWFECQTELQIRSKQQFISIRIFR
jgi:hypothetical protein